MQRATMLLDAPDPGEGIMSTFGGGAAAIGVGRSNLEEGAVLP